MTEGAIAPAAPISGPAIAPERVRADLRYLWPDLQRPGMILRWASDPVVAAAPSEPPALFERVERGLAEAADRYRKILATGTALLLMPFGLAWLMYSGLFVLPHDVYSPFFRGVHVPTVSLYEFAAFLLLAVALGYAAHVAFESAGTLSRLSADLRRLREADDEQRAGFAAEALTGRWPRTTALLLRGAQFARYRALIEPAEVASLGGPLADPLAGTGPDDPPAGSEPDAEPLTAVPWRIGTATGIVALVISLTLIAAVIASVARTYLGAEVAVTIATSLALSMSYLAGIAAVWRLARRAGVGLGPAVGMRPVSAGMLLGTGLAAAVAGRLLAGAWAAGLSALGVKLPGSDLDPTRMLPSGALGIALTVLIFCVLAPIAEEIVFRGVLLSAFRSRWGDGPAIVLSSLVFGLVHVSPFAIPPIVAFALVLGWLFVRTRSLWVPIAAHVAFNAIGVGSVYLLKGLGIL